MDTVTNAVRAGKFNRLLNKGCGRILTGMDGYVQSCVFRFQDWLNELAQREISFAVCQVNPDNFILMTDRPIHGFDAGLGAHTARSDGNITNCYVKLVLGAFPGAQETFETCIPIQMVPVKCPVW